MSGARFIPMSPGDQHSDAPATQPVRSDVERNRGRILAAARTVFGRDGLGASMASVARETGVGIATVFRHFPTKEALVAAVFSDRMDAYADAVATALEDPDPGTDSLATSRRPAPCGPPTTASPTS